MQVLPENVSQKGEVKMMHNQRPDADGYCLASSYEESGGLAVKILIRIDRELNENDQRTLREAQDMIWAGVQKETLRLNPETAPKAAEERALLLACFPAYCYVEEIPNGYCNQFCCAFKPWYIVTTPKGRIKIGWRKRVINIDWSDSAITEKGKDLFPTEDVTVGDTYIHAYGYSKATAYLRRLILGKELPKTA
jgi:hypothetical protein